MSDPREIIADVLYEWDESAGPVPDEIAAWADRQTDRILAALAAAGLLVEPGGEIRTEWGVWYPTDTTGPRWHMGGTPDAEQAAREHMADGYGERKGLKLVTRSVHTTPWQETT